MEDKILTRELLKRIFGNLGAVPGNNFGKVGITTDEFKIKKNITIEVEHVGDRNRKEIEHYPIWCAEAKVDSIYKVMLTNIGSKPVPEFILLLQLENSQPLGFRLLWCNSEEFDDGVFAVYQNGEWNLISMLYKLNITSAIELMTQEGVPWYPCKDTDELYNHFVTLVDFS